MPWATLHVDLGGAANRTLIFDRPSRAVSPLQQLSPMQAPGLPMGVEEESIASVNASSQTVQIKSTAITRKSNNRESIIFPLIRAGTLRAEKRSSRT